MKKKLLIGFVSLLGVGLIAFTITMQLTAPLIALADDFFSTIARGELDQAYAMTSGDFQKLTSLEQFKEFVNQTGMAGFESASWGARTVENQYGATQGSLSLKGGKKLDLVVRYIYEDEGWKILKIMTE